jgi:hypothetical protein
MDRDTVECMSVVASLLARAKGLVATHLKQDNIQAYKEVRNLLSDCQETLALHCDCAPIRLISGQVDEIMENLACSKNPIEEGV